MYSPIYCGGIQYTQYNMANQKQKKIINNHTYKNCREAIQGNNPGATPQAGGTTVTSASNGTANYAGVLTPLGITTVTQSTAGVFNAGTTGNVLPPTLRGLYAKAIAFQWYRVTRAKLIFVGAVASTATGSITLSAYTDPSDVQSIGYASYVSGQGTKTFDLANSSTRELSVPIPVDSSWKRCSSELTIPANVYPYNLGQPAGFVTVNSVGDLAFGAWAIYVAGSAASIALGTIYVDYDVEFKNPIDPSINY